jgi:hypothetical protein
MQPCLFCGGDASEPDHRLRCDGRQGAIEAALPDAPLPPLASGLTAATYATSSAAAERIEDTRETQRAQVLAEIRGAGPAGATDDELQVRLGLDGSSERPRRWELWKLDRICMLRAPDGSVVRRLTRTHRQAVVWVAPEFAPREEPRAPVEEGGPGATALQ